MKRSMSTFALIIVFTMPFACQTTTEGPSSQRPVIESSTVPASELPREYSERIFYQYEYAQADPEAILNQMLDAGIPVVEAWYPLDNRCGDPVGPRFTVQLSREDDRVFKFKFSAGEGRLECATSLRHYAVKFKL